jgi:glycosyltransferase involved in cell wall biosynthesis
MISQFAHNSRYVLVTAAYNEEKFIEGTIQSVISQTVPPSKWIIVSDASTDHTDEIVQHYQNRYPYLQLMRITEEHPRNFTAQVYAINAGCRHLMKLDFDFIGNLDADVTFAPDYFEGVLDRFAADSELGLTGGWIFENRHGQYRSRSCNRAWSVAHAVQLFRRACFEQVGGYVALRYGGPDHFAEVRARQLGWKVAACTDFPVYHHRPTAQAEGFVQGRLRQGRMDHSFGTLPLFEVLKCLRRVQERPLMIGAMVRFYGFMEAYVRNAPRLVPDDVAAYIRRDQWRRIVGIFNNQGCPDSATTSDCSTDLKNAKRL